MTTTQPVSISDKALREALFRAHKGRCFYTGRTLSLSEMVIDHIVPRNKGGADCIENYVPTYNYINLLKGDRETTGIERMIFINRLVFAPRVALLYGKGLGSPRLPAGYGKSCVKWLRANLPEFRKLANEMQQLMDNMSKGGHARAKKLTKKRRKEIATKAAKARWAK